MHDSQGNQLDIGSPKLYRPKAKLMAPESWHQKANTAPEDGIN